MEWLRSGSLSWLGTDGRSHYHAVIVFRAELLCLVVMDAAAWLSAGARLFLLFTWVAKEKYRLFRAGFFLALVCACTHITPQQGN